MPVGREGQDRRGWIALLVRDALLFLAIALAALALDNPVAVWRLWWPMPVALAAAAISVKVHGVSPVRWRHLLLVTLFAAPLVFRISLSLSSALPAAGLREGRELAVIFCLGVALWVAAACHPGRTLAIWLGAIAFSAAANWPIAERLTGDNPFRVFSLVTLGWGAIAACGLALAARGDNDAPSTTRTRTSHFAPHLLLLDLVCLLCLGAGVVAGWHLSDGQLNGPLRTSLAIHAGFSAQRVLWLQSILFGWGDSVLTRLIDVVAEPARFVTPPWGGFIGMLARGGLVGFVVIAVWALVLHRRLRREVRTHQPVALALPAALAAVFMIGLMVAGGPHSRLACLALGGWLGLALARSPRLRPARSPGAPMGLAPGLVVGCFLALVTVVVALPTWGESLIVAAQSQAEAIGPAGMQQKLYSAQNLNPFDPRVPLGLADAARKSASLAGSRDELTYQHVVRLYQDAQRLDPYDTVIPLRLANFQLQNDLQEEAVETVATALSRRPNSQDLMFWLFLVYVRLNQNGKADGILAQALANHPSSHEWWYRQYDLSHRLGQGPMAAEALAVVLTGSPENPELVRRVWETAHQDAPAETGAGVPPS